MRSRFSTSPTVAISALTAAITKKRGRTLTRSRSGIG
jgi:hypothetical protein